ncbi:hypothetical protein [Actinomadura sp. 9N215]|uniref:hypothetical protein n=1 Tax=Actinomadura sp. 9N215 TaxID=3375150 RepID=UPI0037AB14E7
MTEDAPATAEKEELAELLPRWHLLRDARQGGPLRALLDVIGEQIGLVRGGVEQQYDDLFVETAAEWVLPYLGDLVGYRPPPGGASPRRDVAATVGHRRRKGTLPLLEELAESVAGWPARAVELSRLVVHQQPVRLYGSGTAAVNARRGSRGRLADLRDGSALDLAGTPFATVPRTADVRRADSRHRQGGYTPAGIGLYVWRLRPYSITRAPAYCIDSARNRYTFSVLANDTRLVTRPEPEPSAGHIATIDNVPAFLRRRQVADRLADYYGPGKSFTIYREQDGHPVPPSDIVVADLTGWRYSPAEGKVAVDPELGRIAFGVHSAPEEGVWVTYHHAFSDDLGDGEYPRDLDMGQRIYQVGPDRPYQQVMDAYHAWRADREANRETGEDGPDGIIEITHSGVYQERFDFDLEPGDRLVLRGANRTRPTLRVLDWSSNRPDALNIRARDDCPSGEEPRMVLDGLLVTGRGVYVTGPVGSLVLRHSTLVPGWELTPRCDPDAPDEPSLVLGDTTACVEIDRCVLGSIEVIGNEAGTDPLPIHIRDSVLDATGHERPALSGPDCRIAHTLLHAHHVTVFGEIHTHAVRIAENAIFTGKMRVARRQVGCLRYSYVPPGSRTPRRYRCQPAFAVPSSSPHPPPFNERAPLDGPDDAARVRPLFTSERYGTPAYAQLDLACAEEIARGAEDGAEMGVFHDLYQPQRADALRARLAEYTPADTDTGLIFVT